MEQHLRGKDEVIDTLNKDVASLDRKLHEIREELEEVLRENHALHTDIKEGPSKEALFKVSSDNEEMHNKIQELQDSLFRKNSELKNLQSELNKRGNQPQKVP